MTPRQPPKKTKTRAELITEFEALSSDSRINEKMLAAVLLCSLAKLQRDRTFGGSCRYVKEGGKRVTASDGQTRIFGGRVFYIKRDVLEFIGQRNSKRVANTSQASINIQTSAAGGI